MIPYKPSAPFVVPLCLLVPTYEKINGVETKRFPSTSDGIRFFGSFRTFGGTESVVNGVLTVDNTAVIETWFRPEIKANCRIVEMNSGSTFEIIGQPENINMRFQFLKFRVREIKGGA